MEAEEQPSAHSLPKLREMIVEHAWVHKIRDILEVVEPSLLFPDVDLQCLTLEETWRLRVASAQVLSIVKNRDCGGYKRVISFLDATHRLLPGLVVPIKHMKIIFGLKTMIIMGMLRQRQCIVSTMVQILHFFPSKLPQYQDQCSNYKMFLMKKNHLDFKTLAQSLAMDKGKRENYIQNHVEEEYGESYAQKVEDRLLYYLQELETMLPRATYIDKLLKKAHPPSHEEKLLLEVIAHGSVPMETSLKRLLLRDYAACCQIKVAQKSTSGAKIPGVGSFKAMMNGTSSMVLPMQEGYRATTEMVTEGFRREDAAVRDMSPVNKDSPLLLADDDETRDDGHCGLRSQQTAEQMGEAIVDKVVKVGGDCDKEEGPVRKEGKGGGNAVEKGSNQRSNKPKRVSVASRQFCSRHQRWVRSILHECSEEPQPQRDIPVSSKLFESSSSSSSSQDLTPSNLVPFASVQHEPPLRTCGSTRSIAHVPGQITLTDSCSLSSSGSLAVAPVPAAQPQRVSSPCFNLSSSIDVPCTNYCQLEAPRGYHTSGQEEMPFTSLQTVIRPKPTGMTHGLTLGRSLALDRPKLTPFEHPGKTHLNRPSAASLKTVFARKIACGSSGCPPTSQRLPSRLSRKCRRPPAAIRHNVQASYPAKLPSLDAALGQPVTTSRLSGPDLSPLRVLRPSSQVLDHWQGLRSVHNHTTVIAHASSMLTNDQAEITETVGTHKAPPDFPLSQFPGLLQPYVRLTRLSPLQYRRLIQERRSRQTRTLQSVKEASNDVDEEKVVGGECQLAYSQFDLNLLYSSDDSSGSETEASGHSDPDYIPRFKRTLGCWNFSQSQKINK